MFAHLVLAATLALAQDVQVPPLDAPATAATAEPTTAPVPPPAPDAAPAPAPAPEEKPAAPAPEVKVPQTEADAVQQGQEAFDAISTGAWGAGIVLLIGIAVFVYNRFVAKKSA